MERPIPVPTSKLHNNEYTVGWICALSSEKAASEACLDDFHGQPQYKHPMDKNSYSLGRVGNHNVVIGCLPTVSRPPLLLLCACFPVFHPLDSALWLVLGVEPQNIQTETYVWGMLSSACRQELLVV